MQIGQLLQQGTTELEKYLVDGAEINAQLLLGHCLGKSRSQLFLDAKESVIDSDCRNFWSLIKRRSKREPVAYILGEREFWSLPFFVNRDVLIPRPETEFLLEKVLQNVRQQGLLIKNAIDLCCGSGVITVVLALELKAKIYALDCSDKALEVTKTNCKKHGVAELVTPILSDLFAGLATSDYPLIVSNPPYVCHDEILESLEPEVIDFEPILALDGGKDGLDLVRRIAKDILGYLAPEGMFFMELGANQGGDVKDIFSSAIFGVRTFKQVEIYQDYSGRDRVLFAKVNNYNE